MAPESASWLTRLFTGHTGRDPEAQAIHEAALGLERAGAVVFASAPGWPRPPVLNGFVPDVYAVFEDREVALEFENEGSVIDAGAERKDRAFSAWAEESPVREYDQIVLPGGRGGRA